MTAAMDKRMGRFDRKRPCAYDPTALKGQEKVYGSVDEWVAAWAAGEE